MKHTLSERLQIAEKVCNLYAEGRFTLESCCNAVGINVNTFYQWACPMVENFTSLPEKKQKELLRRGFVQEIQDSLKEAKKKGTINYYLLLRDSARYGLLKAVEGYCYEEVQSVQMKNGNEEPIFVPIRKIQKHVSPSVTAIIFALKNTDPGIFSDKLHISHSNVSDKEDLSKLTLDELKKMAFGLEQELNDAEENLKDRYLT